VNHLTEEETANEALRSIVDGVVGFDSEYAPRKPTAEEVIISDVFTVIPGSKKNAILGWQVLEQYNHEHFPIAWTTMGLRTVQLCQNKCAWIVNIYKMKGHINNRFLWYELTRICY
jgi:hypothetical protein